MFSCQSRNIFQASLGSMSFVAQSASAEPGRSRWMNLLVLRSGFRLLLFVLLPLRTLVHCGQPQEGRARHDRDTVFRGCCDRAALDHDEGRLRRLVQLMLESGMRPEEVYRIGQENVNLAADSSQTRTADQGSRRRGPLTSSAKSVLARRLSDPDRPFSFPCETDSSRPIPRVNNAHDRAVRDSKVAPFRLYDVRPPRRHGRRNSQLTW